MMPSLKASNQQALGGLEQLTPRACFNLWDPGHRVQGQASRDLGKAKDDRDPQVTAPQIIVTQAGNI